MSDITKTIDDIVDESFDSTGHLKKSDAVANAMKAWRAGELTLEPDNVRRADILNQALKAWRDSSSTVEPREARRLMEQAVDDKVLLLIDQTVKECLKEREPTAEDLEWFASRFRA